MAHPQMGRAGVGYEISLAVRALLRAGRHMQAAMGRKLSLGETDLNAMDELVASGDPIGPVELGNRLEVFATRSLRAHGRKVPQSPDRRWLFTFAACSSADRELLRHRLGRRRRRLLLGTLAPQILDHLLPDRIGTVQGDRLLEGDFRLLVGARCDGTVVHVRNSMWT